MKRLVREYEFSPEQRNRVKEMASRLGITETTASILFARGQDTEEKMKRFLRPSKENLLSPFLMRGMREAVELLECARRENWRVVIFGDYDADGIGACAILSRALREYGIEPEIYVPEREEGYGLSVEAIDRIFAQFRPDLIVTVDCGISNAAEVEYIKGHGANVIVTDHHELPEELPQCICINPKLKDDYPYDNLCGAGVAYKLSSALIGERANKLLDFCALSTVADSVPLLGENRDIVYEGLKLIERVPRPAISALLGKATEITAQTLAFTLAPRVNAAGRMGNARAALRLFTTEDESEIEELSIQLNAYNLERQNLCDELYEKARRQILEKGAYDNVMMLVGEDWHAGLIGIVAARIAEEYYRPTLLFVKRGEMLRGSARSIDCFNVFEALKACSEYIEEFGGHAQAAGVNVKAENFEALKKALNSYVNSSYKREDFEPILMISEEISGEFSQQLAHELNSLEPYGVGNRKPLFSFRAGRMNASFMKPGSPHVTVTGKDLDFVYFGGAKDLRLMKSEIEKQIVFECNVSRFRGKESVKGFIRSIVYQGDCGQTNLEGFEELVRSLGSERGEMEILSKEKLNELIKSRDAACAYGLCVIAQEEAVLEQYPAAKGLAREIFRPSSNQLRNIVLLAPIPECDLSGYREILFLEAPISVPFRTGKAKLYASGELSSSRRLQKLDLSRESMIKVFMALRSAEGEPAGSSYAETARLAAFKGCSEEQTILALAVFEELGLIDLSDGKIKMIRGKKTELTNSVLYTAALRLQAENA